MSGKVRMRGRVLLMSLPACLVMSCAGANLVNVWRDPEYESAPMKTMLVVRMSGDQATRRLWEDGFVLELKSHGVDATPSYREFPDAVPTKAQIVAAVKGTAYDGVLLTHQLSSEVERHFVPGYRFTEPVDVLDPWGHYETWYRQVRHPGHFETERIVRNQTDVWSTRDAARMIWSAVGEVLDPVSGEAIGREISRRVVPELAHAGLIPGGRPMAARPMDVNRGASTERLLACRPEGRAARAMMPS